MPSTTATTWLQQLQKTFLSPLSHSDCNYSRLRDDDDDDDDDESNMAVPPEGITTTTTTTDSNAHDNDDNDDDELAKRVLRKIDARLMPLLFITYMLNFMDKTILSSASVFGLTDDTHLVGQQYAWVSAVFYIGYLAWTYPANLVLPRVPSIARYMAAHTLVWGAAVALTAACSSFGALMAARCVLGAAEAAVTPAAMFVTATWYTRDEMPVRTGIWFSGNSIGGLAASVFAFGVGHISSSSGLAPWRWMYVILGAATLLWAGVLAALMPGSGVATARFLRDGAERRCAAERVVVAGTGSTARRAWRWAQTREAVADPKTWLLAALALATQMPNSGTQNFANLVIKSFGFSSLQSTLVNIPYSLLSGGVIVLTGWLAGRSRALNCALIVAVVAPCVAGAAVIYSRAHYEDQPAVQLLGYFLLAPGPAAMPLAMSLLQANYRGVTKKLTATAIVFIAYCAGNIAGPHFFRTAEAPRYGTAFAAILVCYSLVALLALALRVYLARVNARRTREEGFEGCAGASGVVGGGGGTKVVVDVGREGVGAVPELGSEDFEDVTDWEIGGFRYRL